MFIYLITCLLPLHAHKPFHQRPNHRASESHEAFKMNRPPMWFQYPLQCNLQVQGTRKPTFMKFLAIYAYTHTYLHYFISVSTDLNFPRGNGRFGLSRGPQLMGQNEIQTQRNAKFRALTPSLWPPLPPKGQMLGGCENIPPQKTQITLSLALLSNGPLPGSGPRRPQSRGPSALVQAPPPCEDRSQPLPLP